jgi:outer membrane murein-binding lipoprotein Lpp
MAISWKIDELRNTVAAQMAQIDRIDVAIDELSARAEAAENEAKRARQLLQDVYDAFSYAWPLEYVEKTGEFLAKTKGD